MTIMTTVISTQQLTRSFGKTLAVDGLTLEIAEGEVFGFLGHNGAGKTTTVRLINGVLTPTSGEVRVFGLDPTKDGAKIRARTGVLTETPALDDRLTARSTLLYFADMFGVPKEKVQARVDELLEFFDLAPRGKDKVGGFSKGMRQRLALARTLLHDPQVVFLDEPTSGLDPAATREVHQMIQQLRARGSTVFLATHNLAEAERLCDRVAVLAHGRALAIGSIEELAARLNRGQRLLIEVDTHRQDEVQALLRPMLQVTQIEPVHEANGYAGSGALLRVHGIARSYVPEVVARLAGAGVPIYRVEPDAPSLEDVYFALEHG
jgi:ABC-2 type transport system ATP-binding protein